MKSRQSQFQGCARHMATKSYSTASTSKLPRDRLSHARPERGGRDDDGERPDDVDESQRRDGARRRARRGDLDQAGARLVRAVLAHEPILRPFCSGLAGARLFCYKDCRISRLVTPAVPLTSGSLPDLLRTTSAEPGHAGSADGQCATLRCGAQQPASPGVRGRCAPAYARVYQLQALRCRPAGWRRFATVAARKPGQGDSAAQRSPTQHEEGGGHREG